MDAQDNRPSELHFALVRPPFWSAGILAAVAVLGLVGFSVLDALASPGAARLTGELLGPLLMLAAVALAVTAWMGRRLWVRLRPMPALELLAEGLRAPEHAESRATVLIPYRELLSVAVVGSANNPQLLLETRKRLLTLPFACFASPDGAEQAIAEINRRVMAQPEGRALAELAARRRALAAQALKIRPLVTQSLLGLIVVLFVNQLLTDGMVWPLGPIRWGANLPALVHAGDYFRLVSANFLHAGGLHLVVNGLALWVLGVLMERLLGVTRFVIVYLGAGLAATGASTLFSPGGPSVGASGAIFGLLGAMAWANLRFRTELPLGFRQPLRWWIMILAINAALPIALPLMAVARIDVAAHAGGFVAGILVTALLLPPAAKPRIGVPAGPVLRAVAITLIGIYLVGLGQAVLYAARFSPAESEKVARVLIEDGELEAVALNNLAWLLVTDAETSRPTLELARQAAAQAVAEEPEQAAFIDTLATAHYRLGELDEAVQHERRALELLPDATMASQLFRFLAARVAERGPIDAGGASAAAIGLQLGELGEDGEPQVLHVTLERPVPGGLCAFVLVWRGDEPLGLWRLEAGPGAGETLRFDLGARQGASLAGTRLRLVVALADGAATGTDAATPRFTSWAFDASVAALP